MTDTSREGLIRGIMPVGAAFLVLNGMIGAGIFALPASVAVNAGAISPWLFLLVGALFLAIVLTFAELASYFKESGGPVLYATTAFGPVVGFNTGWFLYIGRMTAFAANVNVMVTYLGSLAPWLAAGAGRIALIIAVGGALTAINVLGVKDAMRAVNIFTFLKLAPLILLVLMGLQYVGVDTLFPPIPAIADPGGTTLLLIYAFVGFESALFTAGETANPKRTLPRALVFTVIGTGLLYFLIDLIYVSVLPDGGASGATLADVGRQMAGAVGAMAITLAAVFSIGGNLSNILLTAPRLPFALAEKNMLPRWFAQVHAKFATPANSILFFAVVSMILAMSGSFAYLAAASSLARIVVYFICVAALPVIRRKADAEMQEQVFRLKGGYAIPIVAAGLCIWAAISAAATSWALLGGLLVVGFVFLWIGQRQAKI